MIAFWIGLDLSLRYAILAVVGIVLGAFANHVIYTYCWYPRPISPWGAPPKEAPARKRSDRIPILGWLGLKREREQHGSYFWLRPLLIELAMALAIPAFYWFETQSGLLLPAAWRTANFIVGAEYWMTCLFCSHLVLIELMVIATFIDFDEKTIPDIITIPGTLFALILASVSVRFALPALPPVANNLVKDPFALFYVPRPQAAQWSQSTGLFTGLVIWTLWCFALADRRVILRKGFSKGIEFFFAGLVRYSTWKILVSMWVIGLVAIGAVFSVGGNHWLGLFSALVGLAVGGGVTWAIRIVASLAMRMEALGFGDVTLMAMIGAFIGWQGAVLSFFLAPIAAIGIVLIYFVITRNSQVPFGPYLCAGTLLTIIFWDRLFASWFLPKFAILGPFMLWVFFAVTAMMGAMLFVWRLFKERFIYD